MSTTSKLIVGGIVAILIVALGTTSIIQANAATEEQIKKCNELKASMKAGQENSHEVNAQWKELGCNFLAGDEYIGK